MIVLLDTNILLRLDHVGHAHRTVAREAIERLFDEEAQLRIVPQILYEYWVVATRPVEANGLGFTIDQAKRLIDDHKELFPPLRDERGILEPWEDLIVRYQCRGKVAHDTRIVAAMMRHRISRVLTFNVGDFARFEEVNPLRPSDVLTESFRL